MELFKKVLATGKTRQCLLAIAVCILGCLIGSEWIHNETIATSIVFICAMGSCAGCSAFARAVQEIRDNDADCA